MPKYLTIFGKKIKIEYTDEIEEHGLFIGDKLLIKISKFLPEEEQRKTIFHEACHAALFVSGLSFILADGVEEAIVRCMEHGILDIVSDSQLINGSK